MPAHISSNDSHVSVNYTHTKASEKTPSAGLQAPKTDIFNGACLWNIRIKFHLKKTKIKIECTLQLPNQVGI